MQYNSWLYLIAFLGCTVLLYYVIPLSKRWVVLLLASTVFYLLSSRWLIAVLMATTGVVYGGALWIAKNKAVFQEQKATVEKSQRKQLKQKMARKNRWVVVLVCVLTFGVLFFTKYYNFVGENVNRLLQKLNSTAALPTLKLWMPLGISFYTLSAVSYLVDVSQGSCKPQKNYAKLLSFLMFFPVITEGPISRYGQLGEQVSQGHAFDYRKFGYGLQLIVWGLFQKVVLADRLDRFVGAIFDHSENYSGWIIVIAALAYTFQIYMDFAGCIDIARGSAELFGIELPENFRRPFFATSVNDFWRRWHITLGAWLRDYIFYPLSMSHGFQTLSKHSRKHLNAYYAATIPALIALLGVWLGNGIWHGAAWKYIAYGLYYYLITALGMLFEPLFVRLLKKLHLRREQKGYKLWQILRTFVLVNLGMLIFRAPSLTAARQMVCSIFKPATDAVSHVMGTKGMSGDQLSIVLVGAAIVFVISILRERGVYLRQWIAQRNVALRWSIYILATLLVIIAGAYGAGFGAVDFIYAQF